MGNLRAGRDLSPAWIEAGSHWPRHYPLTLRLRLTFWYSAVLAFIIALFGMVVYGGTSLILINQIDSTLRGTITSVMHASRLQSGSDVQYLSIPPLDRFGSARIYVQVWRSD